MANTTSVAEAWQTIFPGVSTSSRIAIKINCLNTNVHPQFATVKALVMGMTKMLGGTYPASNISLFDNNLWTTQKVDKCFGASALNALGCPGHTSAYRSHAGSTSRRLSSW